MTIIKFEYKNNKLNGKDFIFEKETNINSVIYIDIDHFHSNVPKYNLTEECKKKYNITNPLQLSNKKVKLVNKKYNNKKIVKYYTTIDYVKHVKYEINDYCWIKDIHIYTYSFMNERMIRETFNYYKNNSHPSSLYYYNLYLRNNFVVNILFFLKCCNDYYIPNELFLYILSFIPKNDFSNKHFFSIEKVCMI